MSESTTIRGGDPLVIPTRVRVLRTNCLGLYRLWWAVHYFIGFIGVLAGGLAGFSAANETVKAWGWAIGALAAVCTSLVTFLGPLQKAERYWKAYHQLDQACLEYEHEHKSLRSLFAEAKLVRGIIIGGGVTHEAEPSKELPRAKDA